VMAGAWFTFMFTTCVALGEMPLAQLTVKLNAPLALGEPESTPLEALSERPPGSAPALTLQVKNAGKPVAVKVWL